MTALGRFFWFICFAVILANVAIWRPQVYKLVGLNRITQDDADAFLRAMTLGLAAPCLLLGLISLRAHYTWPTCLGTLSFQDTARAAGSIVMILWWVVVLAWVWIGQGAVLLSRVAPVLWKIPNWNTSYSPKLIRVAVTAIVLIAAVGGLLSKAAGPEESCRATTAAA